MSTKLKYFKTSGFCLKQLEKYNQEIEDFAIKQKLSCEWVEKGIRKEDFVEKYRTHFEKKDKFGVYYILRSKENESTLRVVRPNRKDCDKENWLAKTRKPFGHYYFYIHDPVLGNMCIRVASYLPFKITVYLNGHSYIERYLKNHYGKKSIYKKRDNAFLNITDVHKLLEAKKHFTADLISERINHWLKVVGPKLEKYPLRYNYFIDQIEYCRNLIFKSHGYLSELFKRSCELSLQLISTDSIRQIFASKAKEEDISKSLNHSEDGYHIFKSWFKRSSIKQYRKFSNLLRYELTCNHLPDMKLKKALEHLPQFKQKAEEVLDRYSETEAAMMNCHADVDYFLKHSRSVMVGQTKIAGLQLHQERINRMLEVLLHDNRSIGQWKSMDVRQKILGSFEVQEKEYSRNPVGRLVTRVTTDVESLNEVLTSGVVAIFGDLFTLIGIVIVMLSINTKLALITFSVIPLLIFVTILFRKKVRESFRNIRKRIAKINAYLQENISGMYIVQLFSREDKNFRQFSKLNQDHLDAYIKTIFYFSLFYPIVEFIGYLAMGTTIAYGGWKTASDAITLGVLVAFIQYAQQFFRPISDLAEKYNILQGAMASAERIFKILDEKPTVLSPSSPVELAAMNKKIEFNSVTFAYDEENFVLEDISFDIQKGQKVAIVGHTGAGKTSIINLLCRFYDPQKGKISIDGVDIKDLSMENLRNRIAIVQQDIFIFAGSVAQNIRLGEDFTQDQIQIAASQVAAEEFIQQLSDGYDTDVRERGSLISTGQKQLLAFARALAFDPEILILDEATASVDPHTESLIQKALDKLLADRTSIVIAHRLSTIQKADQIIVLHKGHIKEMGSHSELMRSDGIYSKLYKIQYGEHIRLKEERGVRIITD